MSTQKDTKTASTKGTKSDNIKAYSKADKKSPCL